jgi:hypothetical protein
MARRHVGKLCGLAFVASDGSTVDLSASEQAAVMLADREVRREVLRRSAQFGGRGRVIWLKPPAGLR